jgi:hypothetical protein
LELKQAHLQIQLMQVPCLLRLSSAVCSLISAVCVHLCAALNVAPPCCPSLIPQSASSITLPRLSHRSRLLSNTFLPVLSCRSRSWKRRTKCLRKAPTSEFPRANGPTRRTSLKCECLAAAVRHISVFLRFQSNVR